MPKLPFLKTAKNPRALTFLTPIPLRVTLMPSDHDMTPSFSAADEVRIQDLWCALMHHKWLVLGLPLIAGVVATGIVNVMSPQWEAVAPVMIGQVGQVGQVGQSSTLIEPVPRAVERLKLRSFQNAVLARLSLPADPNEDDRTKLYLRTLHVKALPQTDLIEIKVRGYSIENAKRYAVATVDELRAAHEKWATPAILRLKSQLTQISDQIEAIQAERDRLRKAMGSKPSPGARDAFMQNVVLANVLIQRDEELRNLQRMKLTYEEQLTPLRTYPTSLVGPVYVPATPVSPRKALIVVTSGLVGFFLGVFAAFVLEGRKRRSASAS